MTAYNGAPSGGVASGGYAVIDVNIIVVMPVSDIQALDAGTLVTLYVLDTTVLGGARYYLSPSVNEFGAGIIWKGLQGETQTYTPFPLVVDGFERNTTGTQNRPTLTVSNASHTISDLVRQYGDLCGCTVVRRRVMARHLDLANFAPGSALYLANVADRRVHLRDDIYYIERRSAETPVALSFELSNAMDIQGVQIPRRVVQRTLCQWIFKGTDDRTSCPYVGPASSCAKTISACKTLFPNQPLPFGAFTGARRS